ncbi:META domain-containing protein [Agitococcus lubricus]|uniref:META domain-containing protein n=2 Tax=Agitococcus lubricus TaxID=1077255 RepID=A0A2T5J2C6_9GAMM|nr:META domain-containing protein [Agitococcus lubricus]
MCTLVLWLSACTSQQPDPRFQKTPPLPILVEPVTQQPVEPQALIALEDRIWQLVALTKSVNANHIQDGAFLSFQSANQQLKGSTGCNRLMGTYERHQQQLRMLEIASTKKFCPSGGIVQEAIFIQALNDTRFWQIEQQHLYLLDEQKQKLAIFELR